MFEELRRVLDALVRGGLLLNTETTKALFERDTELWDAKKNAMKLLNGLRKILEDENDDILEKLTTPILRRFRRVLRLYRLMKRTVWVNSVLYRDIQYRRHTTQRRAADGVAASGAETTAIAGVDEDSDVEDEMAKKAFKDEEDGVRATAAGDSGRNGRVAEKAIGSCQELSQFIYDVVTAAPKNLFHCIRMHEGIKAHEFRAAVREIARYALDLQQECEELQLPNKVELVAFIDELNTTSIMVSTSFCISLTTVNDLFSTFL